MKSHRRYGLTGLLLALMLVGAACGDSSDSTTTAPPATVATTTAAPTPTMAALDINAIAADFTSTIPEGWLAVSDVTAFKDAMTTANALVIDVREEGEYAEGHIEGAINIPLRSLSDNLDKIPTDRQVFVYCKSGLRAALAGSSLHMLGYDNVLIYPPSWNGWLDAGEPVSTTPVEAELVAAPALDVQLVTIADDFLNGIPEGFLSAGDVTAVKEAITAGVALLDVRTPEEFAAGHLPGAFNISLRELTTDLGAIPTDNTVIVYCGSGHRAALAVPVLQMLGFDNTKVFAGSYKAWVAAGEEVVTN